MYSIWVGGDAWEWNRMANRYVSIGLPSAVVIVFIVLGSILAKSNQEAFRSPLNVLLLTPLLGLMYTIFIFSDTNLYASLMLGIVLILLSVVLFANIARIKSSQFQSAILTMVVISFMVLTTTSAFPAAAWLINRGGGHVAHDQLVTAYGKALALVTQKRAVIAVVWAGATAYYSRRPMVDLLGKSDRVIAKVPPIGDLHPGHNKYDYEYSIKQLQPDVVFQLWGKNEADVQKLKEWGYILRCHEGVGAAWYRAGSSLVNWSLLDDCSS